MHKQKKKMLHAHTNTYYDVHALAGTHTHTRRAGESLIWLWRNSNAGSELIGSFEGGCRQSAGTTEDIAPKPKLIKYIVYNSAMCQNAVSHLPVVRLSTVAKI